MVKDQPIVTFVSADACLIRPRVGLTAWAIKINNHGQICFEQDIFTQQYRVSLPRVSFVNLTERAYTINHKPAKRRQKARAQASSLQATARHPLWNNRALNWSCFFNWSLGDSLLIDLYRGDLVYRSFPSGGVLQCLQLRSGSAFPCSVMIH